MSSPNKEDNITKYIDYEISFHDEKNVIFQSCEVNYLMLIISIKKKKELDEENNNSIIIKKILQANIADTKINYYFYFELLLIKDYININDNNKNEFMIN